MGCGASKEEQTQEKQTQEEQTPDRAVANNNALVFVKPHANYDAVNALVKEKLAAGNFKILAEGSVTGEKIDSDKIIDNHYATLARYAVEVGADKLPVPEETQKKFQEQFGTAWSELIAAGSILNAKEAAAKLGDISATDLSDKWKSNDNRMKLAPGLYVTKFESDGIYVINGFYLVNREKFTKPGSAVNWYTIEWAEDAMPWADFRAKFIGPTNPNDAPAESLRGIIFKDWEKLGLSEIPNVSDNGVHASAGPIEGLNERGIWTGSTIESDPYGKVLIETGCDMDLVKEWLANPIAEVNGKSQPVYDHLEDQQSTDVTAIIKDFKKGGAKPADEAETEKEEQEGEAEKKKDAAAANSSHHNQQAQNVETMTVKVHGGPNFHSTAVPSAYDGKFTLIASEPKDEDGSGEGPNPMEYGVMSIPVCQQEECNVVAEQCGFTTKEKAELGKIAWVCEFDVDLKGYMGVEPKAMAAKDVFKKVFVSANLSEELHTGKDIEVLRAAVNATCPMMRLLESAGVQVEQKWTIGDAKATNEVLEVEAAPGTDSTTFRMGVTVQGEGFHSDVEVQDEDKHTVQLAEPVDDGGSGKGPNPMEALITSYATCEFEQSLMIAKEMKVESWVVDMDASFEINLDGYMNLEQGRNLKASDVFRKISAPAQVTTDADQETIDKILEQTRNRCPLVRLFVDAGTKIDGAWTKAA